MYTAYTYLLVAQAVVYLAALRALQRAALELRRIQVHGCLLDWRVLQDFISPNHSLIILDNYFELTSTCSNHQTIITFLFALIARKESLQAPLLRVPRLRPRPPAMAPAASCKFELSTFLVSTGSFRPATDSIRPSTPSLCLRLTPSPQIPPMPSCCSRIPHALSGTTPASAILWCRTKPRWVEELTMLIP